MLQGGNIREGGKEKQSNFTRYESRFFRNLRPKNPNILDFYQGKLYNFTLNESTNRVENVDSLKTKRSREFQFQHLPIGKVIFLADI